VIGISSGVTEVERRAVHDATINAGAREVFLIEEPMAAAIGAGLPVQDAAGSMIVDIGGGTTEVAVISLGGIVASRWIRIAGDEMDQDIVTHMRQRYNLLIGERMAEEAKIAIASCEPVGVRGRDLKSGLAAEVTVAPEEIREAIGGSVNAILDAVTDTIEETPPELVADLLVRGIVLAGGGALLPGLVEQLQERTRMRVLVADDPLGCVVRGTGKVLGDLDRMRKAFAESQARRVPPRH
jgi:rod shape-determining protein MreB